MLSAGHQLRGVAGTRREDDGGRPHHAPVTQAHPPRPTVADLDGLHAGVADDARPGTYGDIPQSMNEGLPAAVDVVDGVLERALELVHKDLRAYQVERGGVDKGVCDGVHQPAQTRTPDLPIQPIAQACPGQLARAGPPKRGEKPNERELVPRSEQVGAQEPGGAAREGTQLAPVQHEYVVRCAVTVTDAQLLEDPRGRSASVEGVYPAVEQEASGLPGDRATAEGRRLLEEGNLRACSGEEAGGGEARHPAPHHRHIRLREFRIHPCALLSLHGWSFSHVAPLRLPARRSARTGA